MIKINSNIFNSTKTWISIMGLLSACLIQTVGMAANPVSIFDLMNHQEVLEVTLEGDFETLKTSRRSAEGQMVSLKFEDAAGEEQSWNLEVTLRGNFRRMRCTAMPPMKLNFKKKELKEAGLAKFDDMKLVTQCMEDDEYSKAAVLKEYLAYKIYNEVTVESFKVQLLKITYIDTNSGSSSKQWGFLIEDTAQMRNRLGAKKTEQERGLKREAFNQTAFYKTAIFQYMIGNSDWDVTASRNVKMIIKDGKTLMIPYDFDFSGLVDASYALPNANYVMTSVQDRIYMGFEEDLTNLDATLDFYKTKKGKIKELVKNFKVLRMGDRRNVINYLNGFYDTIDTIQYRAKKAAANSELVSGID